MEAAIGLISLNGENGPIYPSGRIEYNLLDEINDGMRCLQGRYIEIQERSYMYECNSAAVMIILNGYKVLRRYNFADGLVTVVTLLEQALKRQSNDRVRLDKSLLQLMVKVHGDLSENMADMWLRVARLRILTCSGINPDVTKGPIYDSFNAIISKLTISENVDLRKDLKMYGETVGITGDDVTGNIDVLPDLLFTTGGEFGNLTKTIHEQSNRRLKIIALRLDIYTQSLALLRNLSREYELPIGGSSTHDQVDDKSTVVIKSTYKNTIFKVTSTTSSTLVITINDDTVYSLYPYGSLEAVGEKIELSSDKAVVQQFVYATQTNESKTASLLEMMITGDVRASDETLYTGWVLDLWSQHRQQVRLTFQRFMMFKTVRKVLTLFKIDSLVSIIDPIDYCFNKKSTLKERVFINYFLVLIYPELALYPGLDYEGSGSKSSYGEGYVKLANYLEELYSGYL